MMRSLWKDRDELKGPYDPQGHSPVGGNIRYILAGEEDGAFRRGVKPGKEVEECRFPGAVGADDAHRLAGRHPEINVVYSRESVEAYRRLFCLNYRVR
jgi:hypothetical protein